MCTLIAFLYFSQKKVDLAIIEVGLGGRLDSTNVIMPLISVITEISLDHTEILGPDLKSIAREKAGIIKPGVPVVCGARAEKAREVIEAVAKERGASLFHPLPGKSESWNWGPFKDLKLGLSGRHQFHNAAIALKTIEVLKKNVGAHDRAPVKVDENSIREGLANVRWPGRMEWVSRDPPILLDGAHNPAGARALVESLKDFPLQGEGGHNYPKKWKVLFSAARDKNVGEMLRILQELASDITICRMENDRSINPSSFTLSLGRGQGEGSVHSGGNAFETYQKMTEELKPNEGLLVTGSLYFIGEIKRGILSTLAHPTTE
jgi:dihydrofolate synthase/folylpolyglutamate synthase